MHYDVLLDDLHLYSGTVSHKLETLPPWNLQHDWPHGVNIVTANSSFGESTTARMYILETDTDRLLIVCILLQTIWQRFSDMFLHTIYLLCNFFLCRIMKSLH